MNQRFLHGAGVILLAILVTLVVWQGSFNFGDYGPSSPGETYLIWALSIVIFILMVTLGFMLVRTGLKLYVGRRDNREGARIRTRLVLGALALSSMPVFFLVVFSIQVLNFNLTKWFSRPAQNIQMNLIEVSAAFERETALRALAQARWLAALPETRLWAETGRGPEAVPPWFCASQGVLEARLELGSGKTLTMCAPPAGAGSKRVTASADLAPPGGGRVVVSAQMSADLSARQGQIESEIRAYDRLAANRKETRRTYILLLVTISLFILFVATWIALMLARQISVPISALLEAALQVRSGNLRQRIETKAIDELVTLVRVFNEMTQALETSEGELERRRQLLEAILESIPTGVISVSASGQVQRVNRALTGMLGAAAAAARRLDDLFPLEDAREIRYLINRARRIGLASSEIELKTDRATLHLAVTVSAVEGRPPASFVVVLEDTSELLRAQKSAAWHEVARRIAHEIKNPLTPISLSAERIARQLERISDPRAREDALRVLRECSATISSEVDSVKTLVDEFARLARFPAAQPAPSDLNEVVENALGVFTGRLDGIELSKDLASGLPAVAIDREQFKRAIVNLIDNAAEAMQEAPWKRLLVATQAAGPDLVELIVADTGCGITAEDKEKLFLPYFSTKARGTGLGLAIVHHILAEHGATIRAEDNQPAGTRFIVEIPAMLPAEAEGRTLETHA